MAKQTDRTAYPLVVPTNGGYILGVDPADTSKSPQGSTKAFFLDRLGKTFETREAFVAAVAAGYAQPNGNTTVADGYAYKAQSGATDLPGLPGWVPVAPVHFQHFGASGDGTDESAVIQSVMQYCITNSLPLKGEGSFGMSSGVTLTYDGDLVFDLTEATFTALSGFPGSGTRMFRVSGSTPDKTVFEWFGGKYIAGNMPAGMLSSNNVIEASLADAPQRVEFSNLFIDMSDGVNPDYRRAGGDTGLFVNAFDIALNNIKVIGAPDLGIYVTGSPTTGGVRRSRLFARQIAGIGCRQGTISIKRDFRDIDVEFSAENQVHGAATAPADDTGGNTFDRSVTMGRIKGTAKRCQWGLKLERGFNLIGEVSSEEIGLYLAADGTTEAAEEAPDHGGAVLLQGSENCRVTGVAMDVNPDLVTALGGTYSPASFRGVLCEQSALTDTVQSTDNEVHLTLKNIPKPVEEADTANRNRFVYSATGATEVDTLVGNESSASQTGKSLMLVANNNGGAAGNILQFRDADGSTATGQPMGRIEAQTFDGGSYGTSSYVEMRADTATGNGYLAFGTGAKGSPTDRVRMEASGQLSLLANGAGIALRSPNGTVRIVTVNDAGTLVVT